jgi:omega-6 fatty acid desaturase (delta-12 desaturase)
MGLTVHRLREQLAPYRRWPLSAAVTHLALVLAVYSAGFYAALTDAPWPLLLVISPVTGVFAGSAFMVGHDAAHGSYTDRPWLNQILGRIAFLPSYHPYSLWTLIHNLGHHIRTNLKGKDHVWTPLSKAEYDGLPAIRRLLYRIYRTPLGLMLYYPIDVWSVWLVFPRRELLDRPRRIYTLDCLLVLAFMALQVALVTLSAATLSEWLLAALFALLLPWMTFNWMIGFVIYFNHTHPAVPWFDRREDWDFDTGTLRGTVRLTFPRWTRFFVANIMDHVAHHLDPRIPLARLREAQDRLDELLEGEILIQKWSLPAMFDILARCKLYDYDAHRWTDYDGRPTAATASRRCPGSAETASRAPEPASSSCTLATPSTPP